MYKMSGTGAAFRVDLLLHSLKEIQQEKNCLETKLAERRSKRREMENAIEMVNNKLAQVKESRDKMEDTSKVAQHKATETQSQANSLEEYIDKKRKYIVELNEKLDLEKKNQVNRVEMFENRLSCIAENLITARSFYEDKSLDKEISEIEFHKASLGDKNLYQVGLMMSKDSLKPSYNNKICTIQQVANFSKRSAELQRVFEKLSISDKDDVYNGIPMQLRKMIWSMFMEENSKVQAMLNQQIQELNIQKQK